MGMYLNIIEYIEEKEKQKELMEMIEMSEQYEGVLAKIRKEGIEQGKKEGITEGIKKGEMQGKISILNALLKEHTKEEIINFFGEEQQEIINILLKVD